MYRRLYFLFSDREHAQQVVHELADGKVPPGRLHALAREGTDLTGLPDATDPQRHDAAWRLERRLWDANLALFAAAFLGLIAALWFGAVIWVVAPLAIMAFSFVAGAIFAVRIPDAHLDEFREALRHGDILLMVDVPTRRVAEIEEIVHRRHPDAVVGGVGWTMGRMGI